MFGLKQLEQRICGLENEVDELKGERAILIKNNLDVLHELARLKEHLDYISGEVNFSNQTAPQSDMDLLKDETAIHAWRVSGHQLSTVPTCLLPAITSMRNLMKARNIETITSDVVDELIIERAKVVSADTARKTGSTIISLFNAYADQHLHAPVFSSIGYSKKHDALYSKDGANKKLPTLVELESKNTLF